MKKRIKTPNCLNCNFPLREEDNFCPECGQENDNKRQTFGKFMFDLFENFLSLDSKFANSLPAILFKPGYLTKEYIQGKRQKYLAPARMFITIVVLYFLISSVGTNSHVSTTSNNGSNTTADSINEKQVLIQEGPMSFRITNEDGDTLITNDTDVLLENEDFGRSRYGKIRRLVKSGITDTEQIMDSIHVEHTFFNRFYFSQAVKLAKSEFEDLKSYFRDKLPWIFFLLMPVFALILKLVYIRRKYLYIDHLIFAFHLHTFFFILAVISNLLFKFFGIDESIFVLIAGVIYAYIAFKKFYNQSYLKTFIKMILVTVLYIVAAMISVLLILLIMFLLY